MHHHAATGMGFMLVLRARHWLRINLRTVFRNALAIALQVLAVALRPPGCSARSSTYGIASEQASKAMRLCNGF